MNYQETINLPKTDFSMKADLVKKEPTIRQQWDAMNLYGQIQSKKSTHKYILHDGPPYANGDVHIGTALNKILKDIVVKFKTMQGYQTPFVPGWDCHGLPIEHRVMQDLGPKARTLSQPEVRKHCEEYAYKYIDIQRNQFKVLGVLGDWEKPYLTLHPQYEAAVIDVFAKLVADGFVYRKLKPIHWCMHCETALAEAELIYGDETSPSIYVTFPLLPDEPLAKTTNIPTSIFIWTTTPWTLPANVAAAVHPDLEYALVELQNPKTNCKEILILADGLVTKVMDAIGVKEYQRKNKVIGKKLKGIRYKHPFIERVGQVILANYIHLEDGTGCVHIAPGHGEEDYISGLEYNLAVLSPVDKSGRFTDEAGILPGMKVFEADSHICKLLDDKKVLMLRADIKHSYPHCWRCKKPVIFRATEQWFISVNHNDLRARTLAEIDKVKWLPEWGKTRISSMLQLRPDWCISRQRLWGVPIPVFYCAKCRTPLMDKVILDRIREIFAKEGAPSWFANPPEYFLLKGTKCPKCSETSFTKENDIFDVWFESGSSFRAVVMNHPQLSFPADLYLEGTDQHRGWFQLSLLPAVMTQNQAPFKTVLTHGFVTDEAGEKVSKSKGGLLLADEMVNRVGADIVRLWISSINFSEDIPVSWRILEERRDPYRKIRNTFRYMLGNLYDFNPAADTVPAKNMLEIDCWALNKLHRLIKNVTRCYETFEFHKSFKELYEFCVVDMSAFYFDILKDRMYTSGKASAVRRSGQTATYQILLTLTKLIAPVLAHTAEEIWSYIPGNKECASVHLAGWPKADETLVSDQLENTWNKLISIRSDVSRELEKLRQSKTIGSALEATVTLFTGDADLLVILRKYQPDLTMIFIVSEVTLADTKPADAVAGTDNPALRIKASKAPYQKCQRCWNYHSTVGKDENHPDICQRCAEVLK